MEREITQDEGYRRGEKNPPSDRVIDTISDAVDTRRRLFVRLQRGAALLTVIGPTDQREDFTLHEQDIDELIRALKQVQEALL